MSDTSDRSGPGSHVLVIRAVFVPDGEAPPPEWASTLNPLRFPVTYDPSTGEITGDAGNGFDQGISAEFHPDEDQGSGDEDEAGDQKSGESKDDT